MPDRAASIAGTSVSGCASKLETHSDIEQSSSPYHSPSLGGSFIVFERDMSDNRNPSGGEDYLSPETTTNLTSKKTRQRGERIRMVHRYLNKEINETHQFSEESTKLLARIAKNARSVYVSSAKKRLQHLEWAAKTLTPPAFTLYVHLFRVDGEMKRLVDHLKPEEKPAKEKPTEASLLKSLEKMSERKKFQKLRNMANEMWEESEKERDKFNECALTLLDEVHHTKYERFIERQPQKIKKQELMSRPLAEIPFNTKERKLVEGLISLLMRTSESVARRSWPRISYPEQKDREKVKQVRRIRPKMQREERHLDQLRGRIELGWQDYVKTPYSGRISTQKLIDRVRALDEEVLGISLLPSTACIMRIHKIIRKTSGMEVRLSADDRCAMPSELMEEFEEALRTMDLYDDWRATNPPDSESFLDFLIKHS